MPIRPRQNRYPDPNPYAAAGTKIFIFLLNPIIISILYRDRIVDIFSFFGIPTLYFCYLFVVYWYAVRGREPRQFFGSFPRLLDPLDEVFDNFVRLLYEASTWTQTMWIALAGVLAITCTLVVISMLPIRALLSSIFFICQKGMGFALLFLLLEQLAAHLVRNRNISRLVAALGICWVFDHFYCSLIDIQSQDPHNAAAIWGLGAVQSSGSLLTDLLNLAVSYVLVAVENYLGFWPHTLRYPMAALSLVLFTWSMFGVQIAFTCLAFRFYFSQHGIFQNRIRYHCSRQGWHLFPNYEDQDQEDLYYIGDAIDEWLWRLSLVYSHLRRILVNPVFS